jgi:uncharacterized protein YqjF (DUF2071 family)
MTASRAFLSAEWRYLLMLNYEIDPQVLLPLVPAGVELETWQGKTLVSMVGFLFLKTKVLGLPIPMHRNFEEVNLRFYVRRKVGEEWRRGVVFVKEIVPKPWIARIARWIYGENYIALSMDHIVEISPPDSRPELVEFSWRQRKHWWHPRRRLHRLGGLAVGDLKAIESGSEAEFITEHYWGYTRLDDHRTGEYEVMHPRWRVWAIEQPYLLCDVKSLYGPQFDEALCRRPHSAFLAEGSPITVRIGARFRA